MYPQSERLTLRELVDDDWLAVHAWASRPEVCRYQAWGPNRPDETRAHVQRVLQAAAAQPRTDYTLAAVRRDTGHVIGTGSLLVHSERFRAGEITYVVHPDQWGAGIGTEIARLMLHLGFEHFGLHRIYATCDPRNVGSGRILQKIGMRHEGRLRENLLIRDGWRDSDLYAILEHEYATVRSPHLETSTTD